MPRIPTGNFGNVIAQPAPRVQVPSAANNPGAVVANAADNAMRTMGGMIEEENRQQQALDRAKSANALLDREMQVETIHSEISQQINDGTLPYTDAKNVYSQRLQELGAPKVEGLDPVTAENLTKGFKRAEFKGEMAIDGLVSKAKVADFRAQTDGILDKLGKKAGLPGTDMAAVTAQIDAMDEIGRQAYGAAWDKRKQDWKDNTWDAQLNQQAMATRDNLQGINALQKRVTEGDYADKLDSNRRNTLVAKLDAYKTSLIQRNEAAAARAQREQELKLKKAEAEFNTFQGMADKGTILSPEYIDRAVAATKGTPYQAGIVALANQSRETGGIARQPLDVQRAQLTAIDTLIAQRGRTPELDKRREQIAKAVSASERDYKQDGIEAGLARGAITQISPIDISTPESISGSIARRVHEADMVSQVAKMPISPLTNAEAEQVRGIMEALPPKQRSAAVATIAQAVGPRYAGAIAEQLNSKDKALSLAFASAGDKTTAGRFTSELILKGAQAIKDGTAMKDDKKVTGWKATIAQQIDGALPDDRAATAVKESAYFIAAGIAAENGGRVSTVDIARSVRLAVGGSIIERNGKKLPIPAQMSADDFESRIKAVSPADIIKQAPEGKVRVAGAEIPAAEFATSIPGQELIYAGPGRYAVVVRGRPVTNAGGRPIILEVR